MGEQINALTAAEETESSEPALNFPKESLGVNLRGGLQSLLPIIIKMIQSGP